MALAAGILLALAAPALGSGSADVARVATAEGEQAVSLLQTGSRAAARAPVPDPFRDWAYAPLQPADGGRADLYQLLDSAEGAAAKALQGQFKGNVEKDANGHGCFLCSPATPTPENRFPPGYTYKNRTDCGGHSVVDHPEFASVPLMSFVGEGTNAYCELNYLQMCATAMWNKDFMFWARNYYIPPEYKNGTVKEKVWCKMNGFLEPEILALLNDYEGMQAKSDELCKTKYAKKFDLSAITLDQHVAAIQMYMTRGYPTFEEAEFIAATLCAFGSLGCDMTMCNYNYCEKEKGTFGIADECDGWDPVKGRPPSAV